MEADKKQKRHGMSQTPVYYAWKAMRQRCGNPNNPDYFMYGGRGIKVCDRWQNFENFYQDMGERPQGKTLDRIDNSKGYSLENCKWHTPKQQSNNTRKNFSVVFKGRSIRFQKLVDLTGANYNKVYLRYIRNGWTIEEAVYGK